MKMNNRGFCLFGKSLSIGAFLFIMINQHISPEVSGKTIDAAVLISADVEWNIVKSLFSRKSYKRSRFGEYFVTGVVLPSGATRQILVFQGGWGKVRAAASTQYVIDRWDPPILINLGTCGGLEGSVQLYSVILATRTVIYDIVERMANSEALAHYATDIDLSWLAGSDPPDVRRGVLVSADQDVNPAAVKGLKAKYEAIAADWESGAIAYTARRNGKRILILRGVSDLVGPTGGEAYGKIEVFLLNTDTVMKRLFFYLTSLLERAQ